MILKKCLSCANFVTNDSSFSLSLIGSTLSKSSLEESVVDEIVTIKLKFQISKIKHFKHQLFSGPVSIADFDSFTKKEGLPFDFLNTIPITKMIDEIKLNKSLSLDDVDESKFSFYLYILHELNQLNDVVTMTISGNFYKLPLSVFEICENLQILDVRKLGFSALKHIEDNTINKVIKFNSTCEFNLGYFMNFKQRYPNVIAEFYLLDDQDGDFLHLKRVQSLCFDESPKVHFNDSVTVVGFDTHQHDDICDTCAVM